ncbi:MAG: hypothetical protein QOE83_771 [Actinomycetota bacterium]|jgi:hypothetical protein|nr:hypothetical protein [Actinomycetota bacterium]
MTRVTTERRRATSFGLAIVLLASLAAFPGFAHADPGRADSYRPDAWIKLCGAGDTCKHAPPHPYKGEDVFNTTGVHQAAAAGMEEGNNIRFWILLENDGTLDDTFTVRGCSGNGAFVISAVSIGALKEAKPAPHITKAFKQGTATFTFPPSSESHDVILTLNILAKTTIPGVRYTCPILITSSGDPSLKDKVLAKMVTV